MAISCRNIGKALRCHESWMAHLYARGIFLVMKPMSTRSNCFWLTCAGEFTSCLEWWITPSLPPPPLRRKVARGFSAPTSSHGNCCVLKISYGEKGGERRIFTASADYSHRGWRVRKHLLLSGDRLYSVVANSRTYSHWTVVYQLIFKSCSFYIPSLLNGAGFIQRLRQIPKKCIYAGHSGVHDFWDLRKYP